MRENLESDGDRMITTVDMPQDSQWDLWKMGSIHSSLDRDRGHAEGMMLRNDTGDETMH